MPAELRVFISHSAGDIALVEKLLPLLKAGLLAVNPRARLMVDVEGRRKRAVGGGEADVVQR